MRKSILGSLRFLILSLIVFGGLYTVLVTGIGQLFFFGQANGSQVVKDGKVVGSTLISQHFEQPKYFSGRSKEVSQLSPISSEQKQLVVKRTEEELKKNPEQTEVPNDLVTASASGVDPDISVASAEFQVARIAKERQMSEKEIHAIIEKNSQKDWFSKRKYVNVLQLNLALEQFDK